MYATFWSWFTAWSQSLSCFGKNQYNFLEDDVPADRALTIIKRKACLSSKGVPFPPIVQSLWDVILDLCALFTWGLEPTLREGYLTSSVEDSYSNCNTGYYLNNKYQCIQCPIGCYDCSGPSQCTSC